MHPGRRRPLAPASFRVGAHVRGLLAVGLVVSSGCDVPLPDNPFTSGAAGGATGVGGDGGGGSPLDPELGGPCVEDAQCTDGLDCTFDRCDLALARCRFQGDDALCDDGVHCDGAELCDQKLGCVAGPPATCGDANVCTIDTCVEATTSCSHELRDADGDGDPDAHCGGLDCDDLDPAISSLTVETCGSGVDEDCDGAIDEAVCTSPENDTCIDPLLITQNGTYVMNTSGALPNYPTSCATGAPAELRDVVAAVAVPAGSLVDVVARARTTQLPVHLALAGQCGAAATELACGSSYALPSPGQVSRIRARSIGGGASAMNYPLYVTTAGATPVTLDVSLEPGTVKPTNETCGTAIDLVPGAPTEVEIVDATLDLATACASNLGELVFRLELTAEANVDLYASSVDGDGFPSISLRDAACALLEDEIACNTSMAPHVFRHALPAGEYFVSVGATAPTTVSITAELSPSTPPPDDEDCSGTAALLPNQTSAVTFQGHQDDVALGCAAPAVDAAFSLTLDAQSDLLLVERTSIGDGGSVQLSDALCAGPESLIACGFGAVSPVRARKRNVAAGDYRVVVESQLGLPQQVTAFTRPAAPSSLVLFADACAGVQLIPPQGGFFKGNTSNMAADFSAGCDQGGQPPGGSRDQLLKLVLATDKRVVFDMSGSSYDTLLDLRKGPSCPGTEVPVACTIGAGGEKSFLDVVLAAGTYFVQIDGFNGAEGAWNLDVFVVDP